MVRVNILYDNMANLDNILQSGTKYSVASHDALLHQLVLHLLPELRDHVLEVSRLQDNFLDLGDVATPSELVRGLFSQGDIIIIESFIILPKSVD